MYQDFNTDRVENRSIQFKYCVDKVFKTLQFKTNFIKGTAIPSTSSGLTPYRPTLKQLMDPLMRRNLGDMIQRIEGKFHPLSRLPDFSDKSPVTGILIFLQFFLNRGRIDAQQIAG
jgi:hypothetical protein